MKGLARLKAFIYLLLPVLLAFAYLIDLGFGSLDNETDEGRRALVAAEMIISGDYITPTLQGNIYLNKPPLYNWIIALSFKVFGNYSMFALRFPVILSIFIFGFIIYLFVKKYTNSFHTAYFSAFVFMTNGRILIYDSLQGLIDITFGWVTFLSFMLIYHYGKKEKLYFLFIISYLLTAAGYMMKGLPAIACQVITLLVYFGYKKQLRKLVSLQHFTGILCFLFPVIIYYFIYFSRNSVDPLIVFENLLTESSKRTVLEQGIEKTVLHFFTFPFEMMYHYAPWTILILALFYKGFFKKLRENDFIYYNALILLPNLLVYWTSPQVYARYLFMLLPLLFNVLVYFFFSFKSNQNWQRKTIEYIIISITAILSFALFCLPFISQLQYISYLTIKSFFLFIAFAILAYLMIKCPTKRLLCFCFTICLLRIGFNWFVVEYRGRRYKELEETGRQIVQLAEDRSLYILQNAKVGEFFDGLTFHIITQRRQLLVFKPLQDYNAVYIADASQLENKNYITLMEFDNYSSEHLKLVKFIQ